MPAPPHHPVADVSLATSATGMSAPAAVWTASAANRAVQATVHLPSSKSHTNRLLIVAALAGSSTCIDGPLHARDTVLMAQALRALGAHIEDGDAEHWQVQPLPHLAGQATQTGQASIDCGLAGTVMRFVPVVAALTPGRWRFDGDTHARRRPMTTMINALVALGVPVDGEDGNTPTSLPFTVTGGGPLGDELELDASASSQFISAVLLAAPRFRRGLTVRHTAAHPPPSQPYLDMSVHVLRSAGIAVQQPDPRTWVVPAGVPQLGAVQVEPDLSNAAPFLAAAMVTAGQVHLPQWPRETTQPGAALPQLLRQLGAAVRQDATGLHVQGPRQLYPLQTDLRDVGELAPVLAAICALAAGTSTLSGIGHLRGHETDRLAAISTEWGRVGVPVQVYEDGLHIHGRPAADLHPATLDTYDDHRLAMAAAVLGLVIPGVQVRNVATVGKTMPDFLDRWQAMLA